jgi:two-component system, chemotaxis family, protein-glutamate methylesterase/glutaminase
VKLWGGRAATAGNTGNNCRDVVVIGGSAGALDAMVNLVGRLPEDYRGSLLIVSHVGTNRSQLPGLLAEAGRLPAAYPVHEEKVRPGHIYVAPPDRHLLLADHCILLSSLPREHFTRPAIDPLFRTAARAYGSRIIGVVLSGGGSDGAAGLHEIHRAGGLTVVQDPAEAAFPEMPETALRAVKADYVVPSTGLAELLTRLIAEPAVGNPGVDEPKIATEMELEEPFALTCPDCGGAVHEVPGMGLLTYRCHTGHRFSADELLTHQTSDIERAVMVAIRVLRERTALCRRMIEDAGAAGRAHGVAYWTNLKGEADSELRVLRHFLHSRPGVNEGEPKSTETLLAAAGSK